MAIEETEVGSLTEYVAFVEDTRKRVGGEIWFRGVNKSTYQLKPGLFRHKTFKVANDVNELEKKLIEDFSFRFNSYTDFNERDDWDLLFLMQHYRIPTRLLDWSSSPFAGLFFALDGSSVDTNAAVWVLDPGEWNRGILEDIGGEERIYSTSDEEISQYHPGTRTKSARAEPLAIQGQVNNPRITAQKGKFVVFGQKVARMEEFESNSGTWNRPPLTKIVIPGEKIADLAKAIFDFGITHTAIFPDLEGLAMEIKFKYRFD